MASEEPEHKRNPLPPKRYRPLNRPDRNDEAEKRPSATPQFLANGPLGRVMTNAIGRMDGAPRIRESLALAYWPRVVGTQGAAATEPESVRDGILVIRTKSSSWSQELTLHKGRLMDALNRLLGDKVITDIRFRAHGITRIEPKVEAEMPTPEELAAVVLEPEEKSELLTRLMDLHRLEDDTIRQKIATRMIAEAKLRHWRLEHGWRVCWRCSTTHKTDFSLCPLCRLCP